MPLLGVDWSENNRPPLPLLDWLRAAVRVVVGRVSIGYREDALWPKVMEEAQALHNALRGGYHALLPRYPSSTYYDPTRQAQAFLSLLPPGLLHFCMLDIEVAGLTEPMVRDWCDWYDAHCALPLLLYGNMDLERILGAGNPRYAEYGLLVADYGPVNLATDRRSVPVPGYHPHVPDVGVFCGWQFAGDNGRLAPYDRAIDLSLWADALASLLPTLAPARLPAPAPAPDPALASARAYAGEVATAMRRVAALAGGDPVDEPTELLGGPRVALPGESGVNTRPSDGGEA